MIALKMRELVIQNYNHPSIVCWGLSNEITAASAVNEELLENHRRLNDLCHELDKTRPTVMADVFMLETDSPMLEIPDMNSYNLYFGWYIGELEQNDSFFDEYHSTYPDPGDRTLRVRRGCESGISQCESGAGRLHGGISVYLPRAYGKND